MATKLHTESIQSPTDVDILKQFILSNPSNTSFKLSLDTTGLTTNRVQTLQNKSGTIALLSDIESADELSEVLANGNTTGANDIVIDNGQRITAASGGGFISLRDFTTDGTWGMGSDNTYAGSWVYGTTSIAEIGFGSSNYFGLSVASGGVDIHGTLTANADYVYMQRQRVGVANVSQLSVDATAIKIFPNNTLRTVNAAQAGNGIVINNADTVTYNASVENSTGISMDGGVIKTDDTLYTNQIGFSPKPGTFEGILSSSAVTADRSWELPDASGTIALESAIPITAANNGLSITSLTVELGGSLTKNTDIDRNGFDLTLSSGSDVALELYTSPVNSGLAINLGTGSQDPLGEWSGNDQAELIHLNAKDGIYLRSGDLGTSDGLELSVDSDGTEIQFYDPPTLTLDLSKFYKFKRTGAEFFTDGYDITYSAESTNKTLGEISRGNWTLGNETTYSSLHGPNRALTRYIHMYAQTTTNIATTFTANGSAGTSDEIVCSVGSTAGVIDNGVFSFDASVIASTENGDIKIWKITGAVKAYNGTTSLIGSPTFDIIAEDSAMVAADVTISIATGDILRFQCTGLAVTKITWSADVKVHEIVWDKDVTF